MGFSVFALSDAERMADTLSFIAPTFGQQLDRAHWLRHWVRASASMLVFSAAGLASGIGLVKRRLWGLSLWASLVTTALALHLIEGTFYASYAFEELVEPAEAAVWVAVVILSWFAYARVRWRRRTQRIENEAWPN